MIATVPALLDRSWHGHPTRPAVRQAHTVVDYSALEQESAATARALIARGIVPGERVAVCAERSTDLIVTLLGILRAGAAYVALEPGQPRARHQVILDDAAPGVVLTDAHRPGLPEAVTIADLRANASDDAVPLPAVGPEDVAYVAYTSGSTGVPKGVVVPHRAIARLIDRPTFIDLGEHDVMLQFAPVAFDASTLEIWAPLAHGACVEVAPPGDVALTELVDLVEQAGVTTLWLTAGLFHQLGAAELARMGSVRQLLAGGDVISPEAVNRALAAVPGLRLVNGYGPTENTTFTCCHVMTEPVGDEAVPIGTPITGTTVHVLREDLTEAADGEEGELLAGGEGLGHGYLGQPGVTAESFVPDHTPGAPPGSRLYRTGDVVRRVDGVIHFVGRADNQVKIRGFRVEPGETEVALQRLPSVEDAAVVPQEAADGERRLVAFVVGGSDFDPVAARAELAESLPAYQVPAQFVLVARLPLTPNGKVDRRVLVETRVRRRPRLSADFRAPADPLETSIALIWSGHLGFESLGLDDDFFELGGHSLMAARITQDVADRHHVSLNPRQFYEHSTIGELVELVRDHSAPAAGQEVAS